ncbi:MAG TPA: hypothetical protein VFK84_15600 [Burkholderiales bacterium]|nr:hypothetical protein [Burkholderiales bacterium]
MDRHIRLFMREMEASPDATGEELCRALEAALRKRSREELFSLEVSFARAHFRQLAQLCRTIAADQRTH